MQQEVIFWIIFHYFPRIFVSIMIYEVLWCCRRCTENTAAQRIHSWQSVRFFSCVHGGWITSTPDSVQIRRSCKAASKWILA
jgi:hypothetical protein